MVFEEVIVTRLGSAWWTMPSMLMNVAWRCQEKVICFRRKPGQRSRGHGPHHQGHHSLRAGGSACGWKPLERLELKVPPPLFKLCQSCQIFLMTGHIGHLDSMVANSQPFPVSFGWEDPDPVRGAVSAAESPIWHSRHSGQMPGCWEERRRETTQELGWCQVLSWVILVHLHSDQQISGID